MKETNRNTRGQGNVSGVSLTSPATVSGIESERYAHTVCERRRWTGPVSRCISRILCSSYATSTMTLWPTKKPPDALNYEWKFVLWEMILADFTMARLLGDLGPYVIVNLLTALSRIEKYWVSQKFENDRMKFYKGGTRNTHRRSLKKSSDIYAGRPATWTLALFRIWYYIDDILYR